jgi:cytochrome bd-type quinol oxidase subunit 2
MAGLGLSVLAILAMFALAALGLAILVRPFVALSEDDLTMRRAEFARDAASAT